MLGIDYRTRNYYVLDGTAGTYLAGSAEGSTLPREQSANLLTARNAVARQDSAAVGDESDIAAGYMDVAVPIFGGDNAFIIYILDNKDTVSELNNQLFQIIMQALIIGLLISVLLSFLLSKTMVGPIEKLTVGAERVAAGTLTANCRWNPRMRSVFSPARSTKWPASCNPRWPPWKTSATSWTPCSST